MRAPYSLLPRVAVVFQSLLFAICIGRVPSTSAAQPIVSVTGGAIRGRLLPEGHGAVFRGIPFARPPIGELRWREPMPVIPWRGVRDAFEPGAPAAQASLGWNEAFAAAGKEDCLYLDVWTPTHHSKSRLPVMVWLHGGANIAGAGGFDPVYNGASLIAHGVVLVVVEYRLGIFGFFAHPALTRESRHHSSGNYAILDQLAALRWVQKNIAQFGGDPANVTLFGQSAGSMDVLALMASPLSRGLFQRAIAESGAPGRESSRRLAELEAKGVDLVTTLEAHTPGRAAPSRDDASGANALVFLRALPVSELLKAGANFSSYSIDGWVFPQPTTATWAAGRELPVPLIIGGCSIEFAAEGGPERIQQSIERTFGPSSSTALQLYGLGAGATTVAADPVYGDIADQWGSDQFRCPAIIHGEWHGAAHNAVWEYQFDRAIPPHDKVAHSGDLPYVFGAFDLKAGNLVGKYGPEDRRLSDAIERYWTNFAKTGSPNGDGLVEWPRFDEVQRQYLEFTSTAQVVVARNQRGAFCDLFRDLMRHQDTPEPK